MKLMKRVGMLAFIAVLGVPVSVLAQQPDPGVMKQDHQMGGMQQQGMPGMGTMKQDKQMGGMQDCKMMEGMGMMKQDKEMGGMQGCMMMQGMKD